MLTQLVVHGLLYGLALSVGLTGVMGLSLALAPDMLVGDYPPDIRQRYGEMSERGRRFRPYIAILFFGLTIAVLTLALARIPAAPLTFGDRFVVAFVVLMTFNLFDLLILDWLALLIQPSFMVLPGTEGMAGYRDFAFHARGALIGTAFSAVGGAVAALVASLIG